MSVKGHLNDATTFLLASAPVAAGTTDITSSAVDTSGFNGCRFIIALGTITAGAVTSAKVQQSSDDGDTDAYSDLEGTSITIADTTSDKIFLIDVKKPMKRYLKCIVDRGTQNAELDIMLAELYDPISLPATQKSVVSGHEEHVSPAEGTA